MILNVFLFALAAAIYPTLLAGVIVLLSRPNPARQLAAFLVGGMTCSVIAGVVILAALAPTGDFDGTSQSAYPIVDIAIGSISLACGYALARSRPRRLAQFLARRSERQPEDKGPSRTTRMLSGSSTPLIIAVGALLNLPGIWYLAALNEIATGNFGTAGDVALVLGFNLVMFTLVEVPLVGYVFAPDRTRASIDHFNAWLRDHTREVAAGVAIAVGIYLLVKGVAEVS